jgi:hypothetical protein
VTTILAYLDPGSGSMILQVLLGGFAAAGVAIKMYWKKLTGIFRRDKGEDAPETAVAAKADDPVAADKPTELV